MSVKTYVITIPKSLPEGAQIKGVVTPQMLNGITSGRPTTMELSGNILKFVKQEPDSDHHQVIEVGVSDTQEKPVRKRQKLDHLSYEEKIMRRKLKNRVAAQTARDRKKVRMDELEIQVSHLNKQMNDMTATMETLTEKNRQLEEKNKMLSDRLSQCTCNVINIKRKFPRKHSAVVDLKAPVCGVTVESAELPQPRAVTPQAALRALFLTLLCTQSEKTSKGVSLTFQELREKVLQLQFGECQQDPLNYPSKEALHKWMSHHQPPWLTTASSP